MGRITFCLLSQHFHSPAFSVCLAPQEVDPYGLQEGGERARFVSLGPHSGLPLKAIVAPSSDDLQYCSSPGGFCCIKSSTMTLLWHADLWDLIVVKNTIVTIKYFF